MSKKRRPPEGRQTKSGSLQETRKIKRLSTLKKDTKSFVHRVLNDSNISLIRGRDKSSVLRHIPTCADFLKIRKFLLTDSTKIIHASLCKKHLLCSFCASLRASKIIQKYLKIYKSIVGAQKSYHVVITIKDGPDLAERYNHLNKSFNLMLAQRRQGRGELSKITSGVYSYEIKRGKNSGEWHPHLHAIMLTSERIDFSAIRAQWKEITGDSFEIHVNEFYGNDTEEKLIVPFLEVFKYAMKLQDLSDADRLECYKVFFSRNLVNSFGDFRGFKEPESLLDEVSKDDMFYMDLIMQYTDNKGYVLSGDNVTFSEDFKFAFKLQELYQKDKTVLDRLFSNPIFATMLTNYHEKTGTDLKSLLVGMMQQNIKNSHEIEDYFQREKRKGLEKG